MLKQGHGGGGDQRACLLLGRSEFESRSSLLFFCKIVVGKNENIQKEVGIGPFYVQA